MASRPDIHESVILALELLRRIPRNRKITCAALHQQLMDIGIQRDVRTIQRQLEKLVLHFDIELDDRTKPYGYRWKPNSVGLSLPMLSEQESLLLALSERYLKSLLPVSVTKSMSSFFEQARLKLDNKSYPKKESEWLSKVRIVSANQPLLPPEIKVGVFDVVSEALYVNRWLQITYRNQNGKKTEANVMPLGLVQQGVVLYLVCRFEKFHNERILALHRISAATLSGLTFNYPKDFSLTQYDLDGHFGFGAGKRINLNFKIAKDAGAHLLETPLSENQQVIEHKDCYEINATVVETARLEWWLRGFGGDVSHIRRQSVNANRK